MAVAGDQQRRPGETVLITGASSGIGRELARLFAADGAELVLVARSEGRLRELADELAAEYGVQARVVPADLSLAAGPGEIVQALADQHIDVDVLPPGHLSYQPGQQRKLALAADQHTSRGHRGQSCCPQIDTSSRREFSRRGRPAVVLLSFCRTSGHEDS